MGPNRQTSNYTQDVHVHVSSQTIFRILFLALLVAFVIVIRDVLVLVFFSVVIASAVSPAANWLEKKGLPRALGVFFIYILLFIALALVLFLIISPLSIELRNLAQTLPANIDRLSLQFEQVKTASPQVEEFLNNLEGSLSQIGESLEAIASNVLAALSKIFGGIVTAILVIVISFYLAAEKQGIPLFIRTITPSAHQQYVLDLWSRAQGKIGRWLRGQVVLSFIVGALVFIGLMIFGIPHPVLLALLAALLEIIPFMGPVLAAIPAIILALLKSPIVAIWTVAVYVVVQQLENHILAPKIMQRAVGLNPVVTIIALLIGGKLLGFAGVIIAIPLAAIVVEILKGFGDHNTESYDHQPIKV